MFPKYCKKTYIHIQFNWFGNAGSFRPHIYVLKAIAISPEIETQLNSPFAAVETEGISSLMFKTSGHFDSIDCTKKCNNVDLLSDVLVLVS